MSKVNKRRETTVSKTRNHFGNLDFGPSPSHELPPDYPEPYYILEEKEEINMSNALKIERTELLKQALANAAPKPSRATHIKLLDEHEWRMVHAARQNGSKAGLQQLFLSMQRTYQDNDEAFFKDYPQFYNTYRQAVLAFGLAPIKVRKPKVD